MTINELYADTIDKLKRDIRPHIKLTPQLIEEIKTEWLKAIEQQQVDKIMLSKILCILDNTQTMTSEFTELFIKTIDKVRDRDLLVYTLSASQKHVITEALRAGNMISADYLAKLKILLKEGHPEVKEWVLRTIESMGPLSLRFSSEIRAAKPGVLKFLNKHHKSSSQIIELMEKQWKTLLK